MVISEVMAVAAGLKRVPTVKAAYCLKLQQAGMEGWKVSITVRRRGKQAGAHILKFQAPNGKKFRSWAQAKWKHTAAILDMTTKPYTQFAQRRNAHYRATNEIPFFDRSDHIRAEWNALSVEERSKYEVMAQVYNASHSYRYAAN